MIGLVTLEAQLAQAEAQALIAGMAEKRSEGGTPAHAMAEGEAEFHEEERERRDAVKARHPLTGQFTTASAWPGTEAHGATADGVRLTRVGDPQAPAPAARPAVTDSFSADHRERAVHPGTVPLQHLDLAGGFPLPVATTPVQPAFRTAPINNTGGTS